MINQSGIYAGKKYSKTVAVVDLGGGSVQMAYALSDEAAAKAPAAGNDNATYVLNKFAIGTNYNLYTHRFIHFYILIN